MKTSCLWWGHLSFPMEFVYTHHSNRVVALSVCVGSGVLSVMGSGDDYLDLSVPITVKDWSHFVGDLSLCVMLLGVEEHLGFMCLDLVWVGGGAWVGKGRAGAKRLADQLCRSTFISEHWLALVHCGPWECKHPPVQIHIRCMWVALHCVYTL